jgi:hypothetical protein
MPGYYWGVRSGIGPPPWFTNTDGMWPADYILMRYLIDN